MRILALGDSITQGRRGAPPEVAPTQSWRYPLWKELVLRGVYFDMVGGVHTGFEGDPEWPSVRGVRFDPDHESRWGIRLDEMIALLPRHIVEFELDVALVLLGGNDLGQGKPIAALWPEWEALLQMLRSKNPRVAVVVGAYCHEWGPFSVYNRELTKRVQSWSRPESPVRMVSACSDWISDPRNERTDTVDWVHPNPRGDQKLSTAFVRGLEQLFGGRVMGNKSPRRAGNRANSSEIAASLRRTETGE